MEFIRVFPFNAHMAVIYVSEPPFGRVLTYSMTRLAKMALTGDPIGQPKICLKWSPWNTKKSRTHCRRAMIFWMDMFVLSGSD